jgi:hypothetical protein
MLHDRRLQRERRVIARHRHRANLRRRREAHRVGVDAVAHD